MRVNRDHAQAVALAIGATLGLIVLVRITWDPFRGLSEPWQ